MAKSAGKKSAAKKQSIGTTLKSLTANFGALARDAQLVALMELTNLYKRTKATVAPKVAPPAAKKAVAAPKKAKAKKAVKPAKASGSKPKTAKKQPKTSKKKTSKKM